MKTLATVSLCVGVLFLQGCTYVPAVEPTDLSPVYEESATRSEIEAVLGEPVESRGIDQGSISIYIYDRGAEGGIEAPLGYPHVSCKECGIGWILIQPFIWASTPFLYADKVDEQEGYLAVVYSADDTVSYYDTARDIDRVIQRLQRRVKLEEECRLPFSEAIQLDAATLYDLGFSCPTMRSDPQTALLPRQWMCLSAHQGDQNAQYVLGKYYRQGSNLVLQDPIEAYKWLSLAAKDGDATTKRLRDVFARQLTPEQIAEAERLVAEWEPNPAECEIETAATTH
jgi:hypothetical protein